MSQRIQKINKLIQEELTNFLRNEYAEKGIFSILEVFVNDDLSLAKVYIDVLKLNIDNKKFEEMLNRKAFYFRQLLKKRMVSKKVPQLVFYVISEAPEDVLIDIKE
ncbi:MAG: ribosome-binding factor A [Patescibacteria group bacterium]